MPVDPASVSVVVTTYQRPEALAAVLAGLSGQDAAGFEVLVADDGSDERTAAVVASVRAAPGAMRCVRHVRHPDRGFRAGHVRNRAVSAAGGDYVLFLDGDCVPRAGFVRAHARAAATGWMARGSRVLLSRDATSRALAPATPREPPLHRRSVLAWTAARRRGDVNRLLPLLPAWCLPLSGLLSTRGSGNWRSVRTCNLAVWRRDLEAANGFDERYVGWGYEDSDLAIRLLNHGVRIRRAPPATTVLHLWHAEHDRRFEGENLARLRATEHSGCVAAPRGMREGAAEEGPETTIDGGAFAEHRR